jgi:hypothetical protein
MNFEHHSTLWTASPGQKLRDLWRVSMPLCARRPGLDCARAGNIHQPSGQQKQGAELGDENGRRLHIEKVGTDTDMTPVQRDDL